MLKEIMDILQGIFIRVFLNVPSVTFQLQSP